MIDAGFLQLYAIRSVNMYRCSTITPVKARRSFSVLSLTAVGAMIGCLLAGCASPKAAVPTPRQVTQAYFAACDRILSRAAARAAGESTVAAKNDIMSAASKEVLEVSPPMHGDLLLIGEYRQAVTALKKGYDARPDWRTNSAYAAIGFVAGFLDVYGGAGAVTSVVVAGASADIREREQALAGAHDATLSWNRSLTAAGYTSDFWPLFRFKDS
ncbi:MAG: hypothetical protein HZC55_18195 [Verrucomicrobia bacterium]|nr:hypothetical protein [Verrucomicrobiota bacterium]